MPWAPITRSLPLLACALLLTGCTTSAPEPPPTPTPTTFRYDVNRLEAALPTTYGRHKVYQRVYLYPVDPTWTPRRDALAGRHVEPEACRAILQNGGNADRPGAFIPEVTPSAQSYVQLGPVIGDNWATDVNISIVELNGELATRDLHWFAPTPAECKTIRVDGVVRASAIERAVPGFGDESRYIVRTFPLTGKPWTERILIFRKPDYVLTIRTDGLSQTDQTFLTFARQIRDHVAIHLKD